MPKCDICNSSFKVLYRDQDYNCKDCLCEKCYTDTWGELPKPDDWNYPEELKETKPKKKKNIKLIKPTVICDEEDEEEKRDWWGTHGDGVVHLKYATEEYMDMNFEEWGVFEGLIDTREEEEEE